MAIVLALTVGNYKVFFDQIPKKILNIIFKVAQQHAIQELIVR